MAARTRRGSTVAAPASTPAPAPPRVTAPAGTAVSSLVARPSVACAHAECRRGPALGFSHCCKECADWGPSFHTAACPRPPPSPSSGQASASQAAEVIILDDDDTADDTGDSDDDGIELIDPDAPTVVSAGAGAAAVPKPAPPPPDAALVVGTYECAICYESVKGSAALGCTVCRTAPPWHAGCAKGSQWASSCMSCNNETVGPWAGPQSTAATGAPAPVTIDVDLSPARRGKRRRLSQQQRQRTSSSVGSSVGSSAAAPDGDAVIEIEDDDDGR